jgi:predicted P-loop ATPase
MADGHELSSQEPSAQSLAYALNAKRNGKGWHAHCPAHDDKEPSLSISEKNGRTLIKCHGHCPQDAVLDALRAQGLWPARNTYRNRQSAAARVNSVYDYHDEAGTTVFQVVRYSPKAFKQRRPDGKGGHIWNLDGIPALPYRLPELQEAIATSHPVFVVEGEKDADKLHMLNAAATCNAGGAGKWRAEHARYLEAADVIIIPDNDRAGHAHARAVAATLTGVAARIRMLTLPGLPDKGDVSKWLDAGGTAEQLSQLAEQTPDWRPDLEETDRPDWRAELLYSNTRPRPLLANAIIALSKAEEWESVLAYDMFTMATYAIRPPPWHTSGKSWEPKQWSDHDDTLTANWLQHQEIAVTPATAATAIEAVAKNKSFHPVMDYLDDLEWDGTKRVESFAATMLGAEDTPYTRAVSLCMFVAAVARIRQPGCKVDAVPILEGPQGLGKSRAIAALFNPWFSDDIADLGSEDAAMQMGGVWCLEIAELSAMRRPDLERAKAFISRSVDRFRPAYGRRVINAPRQCIFVGSTNSEAYLHDETGARRFWPIRCTRIDTDAVAAERNQMWAEAVALFNAGEPWWLTDREALRGANDAQDERYASDPWESCVAAYLRAKTDTSTDELLSGALGVVHGRQTAADQQRVGRILRRLGWHRRRVGGRAAREYRYFVPRAPEDSL